MQTELETWVKLKCISRQWRRGTRNVIDACVRAQCRKLIVTSSGAAYGYHADNPAWLDEDAALRGNDEVSSRADRRSAPWLWPQPRASNRPGSGRQSNW